MKTVMAVAVLFGATAANAGISAADQAQSIELRETAKNVGTMLNVLVSANDKDTVESLNRKLLLLRTIRKEMGEENLLRMQLLEEGQKIMLGVQFLGYRGGAENPADMPSRLAALKKIERAVEGSVDQKEFRHLKDLGYIGTAKGNLSAVRSALQVFYGDHEGVFPDDFSALTDRARYLTSVPYIQLPGHSSRSNAVKYVSGVRTMEELAAKVDDAGGFIYVNDKSSKLWGTVIINCSHKDAAHQGVAVSSY